jgi:hypothetical protein
MIFGLLDIVFVVLSWVLLTQSFIGPNKDLTWRITFAIAAVVGFLIASSMKTLVDVHSGRTESVSTYDAWKWAQKFIAFCNTREFTRILLNPQSGAA